MRVLTASASDESSQTVETGGSRLWSVAGQTLTRRQ
jgi:hypothetical protein